MRKLSKLFSLLLTVAMLLSAVGACAETIDTFGIKLYDPYITFDGQPLLDLSGLSLNLTAGASDDGNINALNANVTAGDEVALNANVGMVGTTLYANVDGMSKPLTADLTQIFSPLSMMDIMSELEKMLTDEQLEGLNMIINAATELSASDDFMLAAENYAAAIETIIMDNTAMETVPYSFVLGDGSEVDAQTVTIALTHEALAEIMKEAVNLYDSVPASIDIINGILLMGGETVQINSYSEIMTDEVIDEAVSGVELVVTATMDDSGNMMDLAIDAYTDIEAEDPGYLGGIAFCANMTEGVDVLVLAADSLGDGFAATFSNLPSADFPYETETYFYLQTTTDGVDTALLQGSIVPDADLGVVGDIILLPDDEYDAVGFAWNLGDDNAAINVYNNSTSFILGLKVNEDNEDALELYADITEDDENMYIGVQVGETSGTLNGDELFQLASAKGIDLAKGVSDDDLELLEGEFETIIIDALTVLANNIPDIAMLMGQ